MKPDGFHEECGIFAIYGHPEAAKLTYLGLYALQHRGQESAGISASDGHRLILYATGSTAQGIAKYATTWTFLTGSFAAFPL